MSLLRDLINAINDLEKYRNNELLKLESYECLEDKIKYLLKRDDISDSEKIQTLKNYFL